MAFKLIVAGSRTITDYSVVRQAIIDSGLWKDFGKELEIVSGCAKGVDTLGEQFAEKNGLVIHKFPADWNTHGKKAGWLRNCEMGNFAAGLVAVWDGKSRGTKHMIEYMQSLGSFVYVHIVE
jgi:hypothetical protein